MTANTIFALASGRPPAAIAIIRLSGPRAHAAGAALCGELPAARSATRRQLRHPQSGALLDDALVLRFDGPASGTGEDVVELHCHGGRAIVDAVLGALGRVDGLRAAQPGEFTRRAFENGRIDLTEAEGLADLLEAETESQRKAALALVEGGLRRQVEKWQSRLLDLAAAAERAIDYDEVDEALSPNLLADCDALASELAAWLERPRVERLKDGLLVVIAGPPNAGKSSLINVIAGEERSIVTDVPGTTRDHIEVPVAIGGIPIRLTDTAGIRDTGDAVEAIGVARARRLVEAADVLVWLGKPGEAPAHPRCILVHAKADVPGRTSSPSGSIAVSATTGAGVSPLLQRIEHSAAGLMPPEGALALNKRQSDLLASAQVAVRDASVAPDYPILAEELRRARVAFDLITGRSGVENLLDSLFSRFCLGK